MTDPADPADPGVLDQIRRAHASARPTRADPAWLNSHHDCGVLLAAVEALREDRDSWKTVADSYEADRLEQKTEIEMLRKRASEIELAASVRTVKIGKALGDRALAAEARVVELEGSRQPHKSAGDKLLDDLATTQPDWAKEE